MIPSGLRLAALTAATAACAVLGAGVAAAAPTLTPDDIEEGTISLGSDPAGEEWTCMLLGSGEKTMFRVDTARVGDSRGGFAPGSTVTAACMSTAPFALTTTTGVTSLEDAD